MLPLSLSSLNAQTPSSFHIPFGDTAVAFDLVPGRSESAPCFVPLPVLVSPELGQSLPPLAGLPVVIYGNCF